MEFLIYDIIFFVFSCIFIICVFWLIKKSLKKEPLDRSEKIISILALLYYVYFLCRISASNQSFFNISFLQNTNPFILFSHGIYGLFLFFSILIFIFCGIYYFIGILKNDWGKRNFGLIFSFYHIFGLIFIIKLVDYYSSLFQIKNDIHFTNIIEFIQILLYLIYLIIPIILLTFKRFKNKPSLHYLLLIAPIIIFIIFNLFVSKNSYNNIVYRNSPVENDNGNNYKMPSPPTNSNVVFGQLYYFTLQENNTISIDNSSTIDDLVAGESGQYHYIIILYPGEKYGVNYYVDKNSLFYKNNKKIQKTDIAHSLKTSVKAGVLYKQYGDDYYAYKVYLK